MHKYVHLKERDRERRKYILKERWLLRERPPHRTGRERGSGYAANAYLTVGVFVYILHLLPAKVCRR